MFALICINAFSLRQLALRDNMSSRLKTTPQSSGMYAKHVVTQNVSCAQEFDSSFQGCISSCRQMLMAQPPSQLLHLTLSFLRRSRSQLTLLLGVQSSVSMPPVKLHVLDSSRGRSPLGHCTGVILNATMHSTPTGIVSHNLLALSMNNTATL